MNITKETLKRIINEERQKLLNEAQFASYGDSGRESATGPSVGGGIHPRAGGYPDVAKNDGKPRFTGANAARAIMSILEKNGVQGSFEHLNAIAYQIIQSGVVQKITHPND